MPDGTPENLPGEMLHLDPENFRLPADLEVDDPDELLRHFYKNYELEEIAWSIAEEGYWPEEPLLTVTSPADESHRIVVEGNRRLATLKLLTSAEARSTVGSSDIWEELAAFAADHSLTKIPSRHYAGRTELLRFLGFRHVSGLLKWDADAKARFVHELVQEHDFSFKDAGRAIGSRADAVGRNFVAWASLEQARTSGVDVGAAVDRFGVFYRALQNPKIRDFVGLGTKWLEPKEDMAEPLDEGGAERLEEFIGFVFGPERVVRESRRLDQLGEVLADEGALAVLRTERDLDLAVEEMPGDFDSMYAALRRAYRSARLALGEAHNFAGDERLIAEAARLRNMAEELNAVLGKEGD